MIGGLILGNGSMNAGVLIRAIGPSLTASGVPNALTDPTLELHNNNGAVIAANDDWRDTQQAEIADTGIPPSHDRESAIVQILVPGAYTAIVRGKNDSLGVALVEAYLLAPAPTRLPTPHSDSHAMELPNTRRTTSFSMTPTRLLATERALSLGSLSCCR